MMLAAACCVSADEEEDEYFEPSVIPTKDNVFPPSVVYPEITIYSLPDEVLVKVFSYLPVEDLAWCIPNVCKRWACVSEDSEVWRNKIYEPASNTHYLTIADCLRHVPKLEGISISKFSSLETVRYVCKSLNLYSHNIKYMSLPVDVSKSFPIKNVLCQKHDSLVTLNLGFCESFLLCEFLEIYSTEILTCVGLCQNLESLTLSGVISCDTVAFEAIAVGCTKLRTLNVQNCEMYTPDSLECLLKREADTITSLGLSWNFQGDQGTLPLVAKYCRKIENLSIIEPEKMFGFQVTCHDVAALRHMTCLKELSMPCVKDDILKHFIELFESSLFKNLEKLDFSYNPWVKNILLICIISNCPNLKSLNLQCCYDLTSDAFRSISHLKHLVHLNLEGCVGLRDEAIFHIVKCKRLRYLNVNRVFAFTRLSFIHCCQFLKYLQELHIIVHHVYDEDLRNIPCQLHLFLNCMNGSRKRVVQSF